jgi:hypothetical protein
MLSWPTRNSAPGPAAGKNDAFQIFDITRFCYGGITRKRHSYFHMQKE